MACNALNLQPGLFINTTAWSTAPTTSQGGKTVTLTASSVSVSGPTGTTNLSIALDQTGKYMFFGTDNHVAVLIRDAGVGPQTCYVDLIDFTQTPPLAKNVLTVLTPGSSTDNPHVFFSQGNGNACIVFGTDGTNIIGFSMLRSDNGDLLLPGPGPFVPDGDKEGNITAAQLQIIYNSGGTHTITGPLPQGHCQITPSSQSFPNVAVGGCPVTPPTKDFTIQNTGDDCLTVSSITGAGPFSLDHTSVPLPSTLAKSQSLIATVKFQPVAIGAFTNDLPVTTTPAVGDNHLHCTGSGVAAAKQLAFNQTTINFGTQPVGLSTNRTLTITNNGTAPVTFSVIAGSGTFQWAAAIGTLTCGASQAIQITFVPPAIGPFTATLTVTSDAPGSPNNINLTGAGCVAHAEIAVPPPAPIDFGQIEQGFRTVRYFQVQNTGDGLLTFSAAISGTDAALFGLQDSSGSITNVTPSTNYSVDPVSPCGVGPSGSGSVAVAVAFFAGVAPKACSATLTLSNANATNATPGQTWVFPLAAEITPPAAVDAGLVIDHSGSMNDLLGTGRKIDAAIAGAQLFVEMLRPDLDDRFNLVKFNQTPDVVQPMVYVTTSTSDATHSPQSTILNGIQANVPPATGSTAIAGGVMTSFDQEAVPRATTPAILRQAVILLTDGEDNTAFEHPPGSGNWFSLKGDANFPKPAGGGTVNTMAMPIPSGVKLYAIGLGNGTDVDHGRLDSVTAGSGGSIYVVGDLSGPQFYDLEKVYLQILMETFGQSMITDPTFIIQPGQTHEFYFDLLRGDVGGTVVMFDYNGERLPFFLVAPNGEVLNVPVIPAGYQSRWGSTSTTRFLEFKVPQLQPSRYAGTWKVVIQHDGRICIGDFKGTSSRGGGVKPQPGFLPFDCRGSRSPVRYGISIAAGSNFRLQAYVTPGTLYVGDPILLTGVVTEAGLPVLGCKVTVRAQSPSGTAWGPITLYDDGAHNDTDPNDGEYANGFIHTYESGTYTFTFHAEGKSHDKEPAVRELVRSKYVTPKYDQPGGPAGGGPTGDCCDKLLRAIERQTALLEQIAGKK